MTLLDDRVTMQRSSTRSSDVFGTRYELSPQVSAWSGWTDEPKPTRVAVLSEPEPVWLNRVIERFMSCVGPQNTGDGTSRPGVSVELLGRAVRVFAEVVDPSAPEPNVICTSDSTILFTWHAGGWDVEVEVAPQTTEYWAFERDTGQEFVGSPTNMGIDLRSLIANLGSAS